MRTLLVLTLALGIVTVMATPPTAQTHTARNNLFIEMGGAGMVYSINYDRLLTDNLSLRVGFSRIWEISLFPITLNALIGSGPHKLEIGGGPVVLAGFGEVVVVGEDASMLLVTFFGYRFQPLAGGLNFRVGVQPMFITGEDGGAHVWGGISFGITL